VREGVEVIWIVSAAVFNRDLMQLTLASLIFLIASFERIAFGHASRQIGAFHNIPPVFILFDENREFHNLIKYLCLFLIIQKIV
jgi:hypothetical protein